MATGNSRSDELNDKPFSSSLKLRLLSWNIDGLDSGDTEERTRAVMKHIEKHSPHVIFLQEVVPLTLALLKSRLEARLYSIHFSSSAPGYFPVILITKTCSRISINDAASVIDFPGSRMGRHLLHIPIEVCDVPFVVCTSHLESTNQQGCSAERKRQLRKCFEFVTKQTTANPGQVCIFGGDLNLREKELTQVGGLPSSTVDVWETCGSCEQHKYTWDVSINDNLNWPYPNKPKSRFDRLYFASPKDNKLVKPASFELVGKERVPSCSGRFPSDHWGMSAVFDVCSPSEATKYIVLD